MPLLECAGMVAARDVRAKVDSPSTDVSMKDGYAIRAVDVRHASANTPVGLVLGGMLGAGEAADMALQSGTTIRILTGARIPAGADTVIAEEYVALSGDRVRISEPESVGRNILAMGSDVAHGDIIVAAGTYLTPAKVGLLAAGGIADLQVICRPKVALIASGDEIMLPGSAPCTGKVYASNLMTLNAWCRRYGLDTEVFHEPDNEMRLRETIECATESHDTVVTSGGAWTGDRDLMVRVLDGLGWQKSYHHVRLGPGKAVGFGLVKEKPVFILPGGPPSNLVAFLQIVLPALRKLCGCGDVFLPRKRVLLGQSVEGQKEWTQALFGSLSRSNGKTLFWPAKSASRLQNMASAEALLLIPEGVDGYTKMAPVSVQLLE